LSKRLDFPETPDYCELGVRDLKPSQARSVNTGCAHSDHFLPMRFMKIQTILFLFGALLTSSGAHAQLADEFNPPRAAGCLINNARALADQLQDWNQLSRYHQANQQLKKQAAPANRVVSWATRSPISGTWSSISRTSRM
jgi:hypothetical protein